MSIKTPKNRNFLSIRAFDFTINRTPNMDYFVQKVTLPGVFSGEDEKGTPFVNIKFQPDRMFYPPLIITFICDEDMESWQEIHNWIEGITFPDSHSQYRDLVSGKINKTPSLRSNPPGDIYSTATLSLLTNKSNNQFDIVFTDLYPTEISSMNLSTTENETIYPTFNVSFNYLKYNLKKVS